MTLIPIILLRGLLGGVIISVIYSQNIYIANLVHKITPNGCKIIFIL
jgi:hypothetical protein